MAVGNMPSKVKLDAGCDRILTLQSIIQNIHGYALKESDKEVGKPKWYLVLKTEWNTKQFNTENNFILHKNFNRVKFEIYRIFYSK